MAIDRSSFLLITGALAAGGAGGYYAHQQGLVGNPGASTSPASQPEPLVVERADAAPLAAPSAVAPTSTTVVTSAPLPTCDDSQGTAGDCPAAMGAPTEEGGCGNFVTTRCQDFKASMKPRVAESAVQCLRDLKPAERCDKARVNLCGHLALVNACIEPDSSSNVMAVHVDSAGGSQATVTNVAAHPSGTTPTTVPTEAPRAGSASALCADIIKVAGSSRLGPTLADCKQTLSGLNDTGRSRMAECMKKDWNTKGLLGCEAVDPAKKGG